MTAAWLQVRPGFAGTAEGLEPFLSGGDVRFSGDASQPIARIAISTSQSGRPTTFVKLPSIRSMKAAAMP